MMRRFAGAGPSPSHLVVVGAPLSDPSVSSIVFGHLREEPKSPRMFGFGVVDAARCCQ